MLFVTAFRIIVERGNAKLQLYIDGLTFKVQHCHETPIRVLAESSRVKNAINDKKDNTENSST